MAKRRGWRGSLLMGLMAVAALGFVGTAQAGKAELKGNFQVLNVEESTHKAGKVLLVEFADFYCPHCHRFDGEGLAILEKEFGNKLEAVMVGYPVIPGKLPTAFDMYEQAKTMGKGSEMKRALFRTIHKDKIGIIDVVVEGVSMSLTQRQEYSSVIQRNGGDITSLLDLMRQRVAEKKPAESKKG